MERHYQIRQLAFELYENSGRAEGRDIENWLEAEQILMIQDAHQAAASIEAAPTMEKSDSIIEEELQEV